MTDFVEIADRVFVLRYPVLDVNATLIVGEGTAMVVDTLSTPAQAGELVAAVRRLTAYGCVVVNTHHHFDHCFGNATVTAGDAGGLAADGGEIWGHTEAAAILRERSVAYQRQVYAQCARWAPDLATATAQATVLAPNRTVANESTVDVGGRAVVLRHLGRGHTAGDLVVTVPDADVVLAGDLIEEGNPPGFDDSYPVRWPDTVAGLLPLIGAGTTVVPGHGAPVDREYVAGQHAELTTLAWLIRDGHADGAAPEKVAANAPFGPEAALTAVHRGYAELAGTLD